ncbi:Gfo/Idh/MocA family protein [Planctomycetota bacterium]
MAKTIGFVDNFLDNFHANTFLELLRGPLADRGYEVGICRGLDEERSRSWAEEKEIPYADSFEAMHAQADYFMILAPGTPETHLELAESILPAGKTTYIDKTFAPDLETAKKIFALADTHGVPVMTSSALRYDNALQDQVWEVGRENLRHIQTWGGGRSFGEYAIHPLEMAVTAMGAGVRQLMRTGTDEYSQLHLKYEDDRTATVHVYIGPKCPYATMITTAETGMYVEAEVGTIFFNLLDNILTLFETREPRVPREETLAIMAILDAAQDPAAKEGFISLPTAS